MSEDLSNEMRKHLPNGDIYVTYGLIETCGGVTINYPRKPGTIGHLTEGMRVKIINEDGEKCGLNESGEICMQAPVPFLGYFDDEESTANAFDSDGWFLTGDIGHFDEEGYLWLVGRKKDIFKYCGLHITPSEIEDIIMNHPAIAQVCVVGIPDLISLHLPAAVCVRLESSAVSEEDIANLVTRKFACPSSLFSIIVR